MTEITHAVINNLWLIVAAVFCLWIICATLESILKAFSRERTKREIAAYIAEGSMTPEEGAQLIASRPGRIGCCGSQKNV